MTCDEETYNDQAWVFAKEEGIKEFGKKKAGGQNPAYGYAL